MVGSASYSLEDLLDVPRLQDLFDSLNDAFPFPSAIIDDQNNVLTATAWQDVCTRFHRVDATSELECRESDRSIFEHVDEADPSVVYRCPHGMVDAATPIVVGGRHLGNVFVGQLFLEAPDLAFFRAQATKYGFDEAAYLAAVERVPVLTQEQLDRYLAVMRKLAEVLGTIALDRLQQRDASEEVREAAEFDRQIIAGAREGVVVYDRDMRVGVWNPFMERLTGVSAGEVLGRTPELFPFLGSAGIRARVRRALKGESCEPFDFSFEIPVSGRSGWASDTTGPMRNAAGEIVGAVSMVHDITDRRRAEQSVQDGEARLRRAQAMAHVGSWELDLVTRTIWGSEEALRIYGLEPSPATLPLDTVQSCVLREHRARLSAALSRLAEGLGEYDQEFAIRRVCDGEVRFVHSTGELVRDERGAPASVLGALQDVTELRAAERAALDAAAGLRRALDGTVRAMSAVVERRDLYTAGHQRRVTQLAVALGTELGMSGDDLEVLRLTAEIHDIGRVAVPIEILTKPGSISPAELAIVQTHSRAGADILAPIEFGAPVAEVVLWHHERLDGSGYPDGIEGEAIPRGARIIAVADVVEAMSSHRPYRRALGVEAALAKIRRGAGALYDADVVAACESAFANGFVFED